MNLSKKTLLYSSILSVIIVSLIVGYFILMLPSLYVSYMLDRNYESVVRLQKSYMKVQSYENLELANPSGTLTAELPMRGNSIKLVNKFFKITIDLKRQSLIKLLDKIRYYARYPEDIKNLKEDDLNLPAIAEELFQNSLQSEDAPLNFEYSFYFNKDLFQIISSQFHVVSNQLMVYESSITDGKNYYTIYIALGVTEDAIILTFLPLMTPRIEEIRPVVYQSLPMIVAVALLLVLLSSQLFSRLIILPIIKLANHAQYMTEAKNLKLEPIPISGHDEISSLGESLNRLYEKVQESYQELEAKNQTLTEENKRQEVFLRASSHQLKTPITAALLLVQGMIGEVGKYKEVKVYLPQVKEQLLSMQKIVDDILYLNHCSRNLQFEAVFLPELLKECLSSYRVVLEEKGLVISTEGQGSTLESDQELLKIILDNLLSNAITYTPEGGHIKISFEEHRLCITNYGATIEEELLPHVFEPFVTGENTMLKAGSSPALKSKSHGLGLYVASYYAKFIRCQVKLYNIAGGVMAELQHP